MKDPREKPGTPFNGPGFLVLQQKTVAILARAISIPNHPPPQVLDRLGSQRRHRGVRTAGKLVSLEVALTPSLQKSIGLKRCAHRP
jgi:hypothetical protein